MKITTLYHQLLLIIPAALPLYLLRISIASIPTNALELLIITALAAGALSSRIRRQWRRLPHQLPIISSLAFLFVCAAAISTTISPHPYTSLGILKSWIIFPAIYATALAAHLLNSPDALKKTHTIIDNLLLSALVVALCSFSDLGADQRLQAFYDTPNSLALLLAPLTTLAFFLGLTTQRCYQQLHPRMYYLIATTIFLSLLFTQSVGGVLAVVITVVTVTVASGLLKHIKKKRVARGGAPAAGTTVPPAGCNPVTGPVSKTVFRQSIRHKTSIIIGTLLVFCVLHIIPPKLQYLQTPHSSAHVRLQLWSIGAELIQEHPFLGIGLGQFEPVYQQKLHQRFQQHQSNPTAYPAPLPEFVFRDPHSWPLAFHLNLGLLGLLAFLSLNYLALKKVISTKNPQTLALALSLITMLLHGLVDTIYWKNDLSLLWWLLITLLVSANRKIIDPASVPEDSLLNSD